MELVFGRETPLGDFLLEPGGDISGVVRDPEGRAFEGAVVKLVEAGTFPSGPLDPFSPHPWVKSLRGAHSGVDGKFTMAGAPVGSLRLFANHDKLGYAVTEAFLLKAGEYLDTFVLTLRTLPPEATVEGRVVDPTGDGVGATIEFSYRAGGSSIQTANDGTFRWRCAAAGPYTILATDLGKKFGGARLTGVNAGTRDLRLLLTEPRDFVVEIVNDAGEAVGEGAVNLVQKEGMRSLDLTVRPFNPPGRALLRVPPSPFSVEVRSPGHVTAGTATIDPANAPQQLRIVLRRLPTIEGRVVSHGKPVKGVWVAFQAAASGRDYGFTFRHHFDPMGTTPAVETGPDGTFSIAPSEPVKFAFLRASPYRMSPHENKRNSLDLAAAELGPFEYDGRTPVKGLEIVMTSGGGIAGTLRLPVGRSPAGQIIGASNGDGDPANTKTRDDGSFEFVQLTPGRYDVKWMDGVDFGNSTSITPPAQVPSVPWNCVVEDGAVTPFDLDYSSGTDPFLLLEVKLGRLALGGAKARGETSGSAGTAEASEAVLDAEGRGRVKLPKGGSVRVTVSHSTHGGVQYEIHSTVAVDGHGETRHTLDIPTGILRGTAPAIAGDDVKLTFSKIGAPPYATTTIVVKPGVPFEINPAPAGPTHVKLPDGKSVQVAVPAGGAVEVKWP
jgi:hypothetical protein